MRYAPEHFKSWYLGVIGFFYAGQGYALGSMVLLLPLYILNNLGVGVRSRAVGIAAFIIFPWYIKFIFGMITDNFPLRDLRRKPYLVIATVLSLIGWSTLGIHTEVSLLFYLSGIFLATGSALSDAVIDGLSVEITPIQYSGRLQGINWGSRGIGLGAAGYISSKIVETGGWPVLFLVAGIFGVSITIVTLVLPERDIGSLDLPGPLIQRIQGLGSQLRTILTKDRTRLRISYFLLSGFALSIILQLTLIMETEFGYGFDRIAIGALSFSVGSFFGSIVNGILADRDDTFRGFLGLSTSYGLAIVVGSSFVTFRNFPTELIFFFFIGLFGGAYEAYQLKVIQEETTEDLESTIFSIYTGISNLGQFAFGGLLIVVLADMLGSPILYSMQIVLLILVLAAVTLYRLKFRETQDTVK